MTTIKKNKGGLKQNIKPSKFCTVHPDKPVFARGLCKNCYSKWLIQHNPEYLQRQKDNCIRWSKQNKEKRKTNTKNWQAKRQSNYYVVKGLQKYNLTIEDYENMLLKQKGVCAICHQLPKSKNRLHIDHDHDTGLIRGLLCFRCNFGLSYFSENMLVVKRAAEYLETATERGKEWANELNNIAIKRQQVTEERNTIISNSRTRHITDEDKNKIRELANRHTLKEIQILLPQYSRSTIYRSMK